MLNLFHRSPLPGARIRRPTMATKRPRLQRDETRWAGGAVEGICECRMLQGSGRKSFVRGPCKCPQSRECAYVYVNYLRALFTRIYLYVLGPYMTPSIPLSSATCSCNSITLHGSPTSLLQMRISRMSLEGDLVCHDPEKLIQPVRHNTSYISAVHMMSNPLSNVMCHLMHNFIILLFFFHYLIFFPVFNNQYNGINCILPFCISHGMCVVHLTDRLILI